MKLIIFRYILLFELSFLSLVTALLLKDKEELKIKKENP